jgi:hypothetical protein
MNDKDLCHHPIVIEFKKIVEEYNKKNFKNSAIQINYYTADSGFYIRHANYYVGTYAIGEKTHPEQLMFESRIDAQIYGCKEFLEYFERFNNKNLHK